VARIIAALAIADSSQGLLTGAQPWSFVNEHEDSSRQVTRRSEVLAERHEPFSVRLGRLPPDARVNGEQG
jgi:hypothetical protein